jgi:hypothetical protein
MLESLAPAFCICTASVVSHGAPEAPATFFVWLLYGDIIKKIWSCLKRAGSDNPEKKQYYETLKQAV